MAKGKQQGEAHDLRDAGTGRAPPRPPRSTPPVGFTITSMTADQAQRPDPLAPTRAPKKGKA